MSGMRAFAKPLRALRSLNSTFTALDAALLCASVTALVETQAAVESAYTTGASVSVRTIAYFMAHRAFAEGLCAKYNLAFLPPNVIQLRGAGSIELPALSVLPPVSSLARKDYNR